MMTGTISGEMTIASSAVRIRAVTRSRPSAAAVPSVTEIIVASRATRVLATSARHHSGSLRKAWYQRSDQVSGGRRMKLALLNDAGMTARIGSTRNARTTEPATFVAMAVRVVIGRSPSTRG